MNMRETSSAFIEDRGPCPPLPGSYHPKRDPDCTLGGEATAVMEKDTTGWEGAFDSRPGRSYFIGAGQPGDVVSRRREGRDGGKGWSSSNSPMNNSSFSFFFS